jgi:hypothetical protein
MNNYIRTTVESLWRDLVDSRFSDEAFINAVLVDCGHDATGISYSDFLDLLNGGSCVGMDDVGWCCNEVLAYYTSHHLGAAEYVRAIFLSLCAVNAIRDGIGNWDFVFDKICTLLVQNLDKADFRFRMDFLRSVLCRSNNGSTGVSTFPNAVGEEQQRPTMSGQDEASKGFDRLRGSGA